jgi:pentose-5-phosphate-3-epimerase
MEIIIAPSILAADFANIQQEVGMINESEADLDSCGCNGWSFCAQYFFWDACD